MKNNFLIFTTLLIFFGAYSQKRIINPDTLKITNHSTIILNKKVNYSAQIGTQPIWDVDGEVIATLHYTYYKRTDIRDDSNRPIIFSFNGGPGSASIWMHMGYTSPRILNIDDEGNPVQPYGIKENPYSIIDVADIVYVNPVNVGLSRILDKDYDRSNFFGVNSDIKYLAQWIEDFINKYNTNNIDYDYCSNPEFLREGKAVADFLRPDRVVLGASSKKAYDYLRDVYRTLYINKTPLINTTIETAEMIKYASNAFLALKISYINEVANLCDEIGADKLIYQEFVVNLSTITLVKSKSKVVS